MEQALPTPETSSFGSLAQSARTKTLKQSKWILIVVGMLMIIVNLGVIAAAELLVDGELKRETEKLKREGFTIDEAKLAELREVQVRTVRLVQAGMAGLGVVFVVLGLIVYRFPVPATVLGLLFFLAIQAISAAASPEQLLKGWLFKVVILVLLFKGVQAAIAFQTQQKNAALGSTA